jgi:D-alanyl-D-alanine carboxypeptidase
MRSPANAILPMTQLQRALAFLGVPEDYGKQHQLPLVAEPQCLAFAGMDRYRRPLFLRREVADAWQRLRTSARRDGVVLDAISGYRSHAYQLGIFQRKLARGQSLADILRVNAAPGYSEHHSGCALDIGAPGEPPAEESFEATDAFAWLSEHAGAFGFLLSYPRGNMHGIVYEPWHWCWRGVGP